MGGDLPVSSCGTGGGCGSGKATAEPKFVQLESRVTRSSSRATTPRTGAPVFAGTPTYPQGLIVGLDVGSTTVKFVVVNPITDEILAKDYQRHETRQPEKCIEMLQAIQAGVSK